MLNSRQFHGHYTPSYKRAAVAQHFNHHAGRFGYVTIRRPYMTFNGTHGMAMRGMTESMREH